MFKLSYAGASATSQSETLTYLLELLLHGSDPVGVLRRVLLVGGYLTHHTPETIFNYFCTVLSLKIVPEITTISQLLIRKESSS